MSESNVLTLADDLKAIRALIDTPEKLREVGSVRAACDIACGDDRIGRLRSGEAFTAILSEPGGPNAKPGDGAYVIVSYDSILDRVGAAIAKAEGRTAT
jgi:hypothetical protein